MKNNNKNNKTIFLKFKEFFCNPKEVILFFLPIIIGIILLIPVDYYITVGGGVIKIDKKIVVDNEYKSKGSFNASYVSQTRGFVFSYLLSYVVPSFERDKISDVTLDNEDVSDYKFREEMSFKTSLNSAIYVSYNKANKDISIGSNDVYVLYVLDNAKTNLKVKDKILKVNNITIDDINTFKDIILNSNIGDVLNILVLEDNKEILKSLEIISYEDEKVAGLILTNDINYNIDPSINFKFSNKEEGPSGGLMITLSIYNKLVKEDITHGLKIAGTGTISLDGSVGEIGGVKYKLYGASKSHADVFLVPYENYEEAKKIVDDKNYNIKLIKVSSFDEALDKLSKLN